MFNYVPIIDWKRGEQNALNNLHLSTKNEIVPLLVIPLPKNKKLTNDKLLKDSKNKFAKSILKWEDRQYYFYLDDSWYTQFNGNRYSYKLYMDFFDFATKISRNLVIPCFNAKCFIDNYKQINSDNNHFCIKITTEDINQLEKLIELFTESNNIDLLIDLHYIDSNNLESKLYMLEQICKYHAFISTFNKVIISSCSFPQSTTNLQKYKLLEFPHYELQVHLKSLALSQLYKFNYIFSDYGPLSIKTIDYIPGMQSRFKLRYTTDDDYLFYIGDTMKNGGFNLKKVSPACNILVNSSFYKSQSFSYGDDVIYKIAKNQITKAGNSTSWVTNSLNHHVELIETLLKKEL